MGVNTVCAFDVSDIFCRIIVENCICTDNKMLRAKAPEKEKHFEYFLCLVNVWSGQKRPVSDFSLVLCCVFRRSVLLDVEYGCHCGSTSSLGAPVLQGEIAAQDPVGDVEFNGVPGIEKINILASQATTDILE